MRYALIILAFLFCAIKTDAQVYQSMPQAGYGPVKRMLVDSVLTIPIGISALRNITGGRDTAQIRYQKSDSSVYVYTGSTWVKLGTGGGGGGSADSTVFFTVYRADTMRANIYGSIPQPDTIYARYPVRISNDTIYLQQAFVDSVYSGGGGNFVPYTGATQDVDLGARKLSAASIFVEGTNGNGHIHLKHQTGDATATGNSTSLYADTNGDIKWKNDGDYYTTLATSGNTANRVYTFMDTTGRVVVLDSGRLILQPIANNGTLNNSLQLANRDGRSYFNISTNSNVTNLTIKANTNSVLDSFVIADSGLIAPRTNATMWLRPTQTGNNNIVANRCAGCGTGSIFSANVGTSAPIFNMLSTGQMSINGETPASTAVLDITSTSRGLLIPRMTTSQRNAISTPATGLMIWNTDDTTLHNYTGNTWRRMISANPNGTINYTAPTATGSTTNGIMTLAQTWNTTGNIRGLEVNITQTASGGSSYPFVVRIDGNDQFVVDRNGFAGLAGQSTFRGFAISLSGSSSGTTNIINNTQTFSGTSGTASNYTTTASFQPTSGSGVYNALNIAPTINQTGGASGISRGLFVNPTLTAQADFRAIDAQAGSIVLPYATAAATYNIRTSDYLVNFTSGTFTATLPTAVGCTGKIYVLKNSGTGAVTIATTSSQTIDGATTYSLGSQYKFVHVVSNGSNWIITSSN